MYKKTFLELTAKLTALGEDADEFILWEKVFNDLEESKQQELITIMRQELKDLAVKS
ncbi:MAG TPA: hypothetical protein VE973_03815 [Candidatus Limnocylindria bacterium]|nr:hypothetical protein [Candidatus Limnocylindria bacterium]